MTEANLDLQPSLPSYQSHEQVYCLHSSARFVHNLRRKQLRTNLGATSSIAEFVKVCTQFEEKLAVHSTQYLGSAGHLVLPSSITECDEVYTQF